MKARHAAALALVVWLLMEPPTRGGPPEILNDAPLSQWWVEDQYDSKAECEKAIPSDKEVDEMMKQCSNGECAVNVGRIMNAECVADDDPRLKEKKSSKAAN